ncbi:hypothetical protein OOK13_44435 [Streptomyces sp. NBC_00378]|uniref:DUF6924 domain-containing protein n=1 Tax=unclassified Streptomyces TaxID=2593676 RepID=UPI0022558CC6|nr:MULTISPECIES: hypothetical protein [unclassified Streptomyces]MCX5115358.1 hypothetical protein [Streptomyces sp. NBC_00378]
METLPVVTGHDEFDALVVRTDYRDDQAWQDVVAALMEPWGDRQYEARVHFINDPACAEATVDEVLTAVSGDENLSVVFLVDRVSMQAEHHPLLAVTTLTREDCVDDDDYEQLTDFGGEFRTMPAGVHEVYANLSIGNLGFEEFAAWAQDDPEGIFRPF